MTEQQNSGKAGTTMSGPAPANAEEEAASVTPNIADPPNRHQQDGRAVDGDAVTHLPPEDDLVQRPTIQG